MKEQSSRRTSWIGIGLAVIVLLGIFAWWKRGTDEKTVYSEVTVERGDLRVTILATGTVLPENRLEIKAPIAGRAEQVLVNEGDKVRKGQILAWMSSTERAALLDAARAQGAEELKRWEEMYKATPVMAPIPGTVIQRNVEPGQTFTNADAIFVMSDRLTVKAQVDETDLAQVKLGQKAEVVLDAYADHPLPAKVDQIAFEAKTVNNVTTYLVNVLPLETPDFMRSGMTVNVTFFVQTRENVLSVPNDALQKSRGAARVLVRGPKGEPVETPVKTGLTDGKRTEILEGLSEGQVLLTVPYALQEKQKAGNNPFMPQRPQRKGR